MNKTAYLDWVWSQFFIMIALLIITPLTSLRHWSPALYVPGFTLILISALVGLRGIIALGKNRKSAPEPHPESQLITTGIYAVIRHPLYLSLILFYSGWSALWSSTGGVMGTLVLALFLDRKARLEEKLLQEKFPHYSDYMRKTARFIPGIY